MHAIGKLTLVKLNLPIMSCLPTYAIKFLKAVLNICTVAWSVRANPPSL